MALGGLWHGAAWNFVLWGLFHGALLVVHNMCMPMLRSVTSTFSDGGKKLFKVASWFLTFHLVIISFVMFRAQSVADISTALTKMLVNPLGDFFAAGFTFIPDAGPGEQAFYVVLIAGAIIAQFSNFEAKSKLSKNTAFRGLRGAFSLAFIFLLYPTVKEQFIYFQF